MIQLGGHTCPVCGYDDMTNPPEDYHICECCGTEFDSDDLDYTHEELRLRWIESGKQWWSKRICPPYHWDADKQLQWAGLK